MGHQKEWQKIMLSIKSVKIANFRIFESSAVESNRDSQEWEHDRKNQINAYDSRIGDRAHQKDWKEGELVAERESEIGLWRRERAPPASPPLSYTWNAIEWILDI
jgi:hypothetical protein